VDIPVPRGGLLFLSGPLSTHLAVNTVEARKRRVSCSGYSWSTCRTLGSEMAYEPSQAALSIARGTVPRYSDLLASYAGVLLGTSRSVTARRALCCRGVSILDRAGYPSPQPGHSIGRCPRHQGPSCVSDCGSIAPVRRRDLELLPVACRGTCPVRRESCSDLLSRSRYIPGEPR
jgi:hypothetical protein